MIEWKRFFPPASTAQVERFEREAGIVLPARYKNFLLSVNGGQPRGFVSFRLLDLGEKVLLGVLFGMTDASDNGVSLATVYADFQEDGPSGFLPIGEDPGGNLLLLALTGEDQEGIFFWDRVGLLANRTGSRLFQVSRQIDDFLGSLEPETEA